MHQIAKVLKETSLTDQQIIDTCAYAVENDLNAAIVRTMLRNNEAHQPRAPDNGNKLPWTCPTCGRRPCECEEPMELRNA